MTDTDGRTAAITAAIDQFSATIRDHMPRIINGAGEVLNRTGDPGSAAASLVVHYATLDPTAIAAVAAAAVVELAERNAARRRWQRWLPGRHWFGWLHAPGPFRQLDTDTPGHVRWTATTPDESSRMAYAALRIAKVRAQTCTGVTARWCPRHGTCTCGDDNLVSPWCLLHRTGSYHAEGVTGPFEGWR
jgi:hypothetical protein